MTDERIRADKILLKEIKAHLPELEKLYGDITKGRGYEDYIYRFYHHSFKVYWIQGLTKAMVEEFQKIKDAVVAQLPHQDPPPEDANEWTKRLYNYRIKLNEQFLDIVAEGTNLSFKLEHNQEWDKYTRPQVEAFFHAKFFLEQLIACGKDLEEAPMMLPSEWAAVLYLFNMR